MSCWKRIKIFGKVHLNDFSLIQQNLTAFHKVYRYVCYREWSNFNVHKTVYSKRSLQKFCVNACNYVWHMLCVMFLVGFLCMDSLSDAFANCEIFHQVSCAEVHSILIFQSLTHKWQWFTDSDIQEAYLIWCTQYITSTSTISAWKVLSFLRYRMTHYYDMLASHIYSSKRRKNHQLNTLCHHQQLEAVFRGIFQWKVSLLFFLTTHPSETATNFLPTIHHLLQKGSLWKYSQLSI